MREMVLGQDAQAKPNPSLDLSTPEVHIRPRLIQASEMGISTTDLGYTANALIDGAYAGDYFLEGDKIDLTIIGRLQNADSTQEIEALPVATPLGQIVPMGAIADVSMSSGPDQVNHRERFRAVTIEVTPPPEMPLEEAMQRIDSKIVSPLIAGKQLDAACVCQMCRVQAQLPRQSVVQTDKARTRYWRWGQTGIESLRKLGKGVIERKGRGVHNSRDTPVVQLRGAPNLFSDREQTQPWWH
mgnify:CR=1 FL=1